MKIKDKKIAELEAIVTAQNYDAQKFCAAKHAQTLENIYKVVKEQRMKSQEEHDCKEK